MLPDPSTPIEEALEALKLPALAFVAVRTFGDLLVEVERGHIADERVLKALGKEGLDAVRSNALSGKQAVDMERPATPRLTTPPSANRATQPDPEPTGEDGGDGG